MDKSEQVLAGLWDLFSKRMWLDEFRMKAALKEYTPSEVHCIEYIGKNEDPNVTKLAEAFYMTRSAISKLTKKLIKKGLIESYQRSDNRKEIYFKLTSHGKTVNEIHNQLHKESRERDKKVFEQMTAQQFDSILRFAENYNRHLDEQIKKLGVDITSGYCDRL